MKYLFKLAWKNIIRSKRRTLLTFLMLTFGVTLYLMFEGMLEGFDVASFKNVVDFETGHFKIQSTSYNEDRPYDIDNCLKNIDEKMNKIKKMNFVTGVTSRILFLTEIDNGIDSTPVLTVGIDQKTDGNVFTLKKFIQKGKLEKGGCLIGKTLAKDMELQVGDVIFLTFKDKEGMYTSLELPITGLLLTADPRVNSSTVFINFDEAQEQLGTTGATEISIKTKNFNQIDKYQKQLQSDISNVLIQSWKELSTDFAALMKTKRKGTNFFLLFIVIIALVGIINTLLMSVYEKRQEIGTLMALGMTNREVEIIFMIEGLIIGILGCIAGLVLGTLVNLYFIYVGIDYSAMMGKNNMGFNVMGHIKSVWVFPAYYKSFIIAVIASVLASFYPAKKIMKMSPVECLRTVQ